MKLIIWTKEQEKAHKKIKQFLESYKERKIGISIHATTGPKANFVAIDFENKDILFGLWEDSFHIPQWFGDKIDKIYIDLNLLSIQKDIDFIKKISKEIEFF